MFLLYHAYVYLEFLILACTIYILAPMSGILYYREGGAPYNEAYYFTRFEKDGTMVKGPTYQCYDSDEDGEIGVEDLYLKDGVEQDRTAWEKETEIYRAIKNERGL